jgi:hypothetical protein
MHKYLGTSKSPLNILYQNHPFSTESPSREVALWAVEEALEEVLEGTPRSPGAGPAS